VNAARLSLVAAGLSHRTAPLALRERVSFSAEGLPGALQDMGSRLGNGVILSTCNRTEIYFVAEPGGSDRARALDLFAAVTGAGLGTVDRHVYHYRDEAAVRHVHRVACGMDSMVLGEAEILRQVRLAMSASFEGGFLTSTLDRLFHSALRTGRRLLAETFLGRLERSVASGAVHLARGVLGDISRRKVLILGAGDAGVMTVRTVLREGARDVTIANRTYRRAVELAAHTGAAAVPLRKVPALLPEVDLVICASASPLISMAQLSATAPRERGPVVVVDIGVPRTVDPEVRRVPGVALFDMDDLMALCPASAEARENDLACAESILEDGIERFLCWWRSSHAIPTITALEDSVEEARRRELAKTLRKMPSLDEEQRDALEALTRAIVKKVLHQPIMRLKHHGEDDDFIALGRELFGLEPNGVSERDCEDALPSEPRRDVTVSSRRG
jgi:glutamyl-tRNA reductase